MEELNFQIHIGSYDGIMMGFKGNLKNLENYYSFSSTSVNIFLIFLHMLMFLIKGFSQNIMPFEQIPFCRWL